MIQENLSSNVESHLQTMREEFNLELLNQTEAIKDLQEMIEESVTTGKLHDNVFYDCSAATTDKRRVRKDSQRKKSLEDKGLVVGDDGVTIVNPMRTPPLRSRCVRI